MAILFLFSSSTDLEALSLSHISRIRVFDAKIFRTDSRNWQTRRHVWEKKKKNESAKRFYCKIVAAVLQRRSLKKCFILWWTQRTDAQHGKILYFSGRKKTCEASARRAVLLRLQSAVSSLSLCLCIFGGLSYGLRGSLHTSFAV